MFTCSETKANAARIRNGHVGNEQTRVPNAQEEWKSWWAFDLSSQRLEFVAGGECQP